MTDGVWLGQTEVGRLAADVMNGAWRQMRLVKSGSCSYNGIDKGGGIDLVVGKTVYLSQVFKLTGKFLISDVSMQRMRLRGCQGLCHLI